LISISAGCAGQQGVNPRPVDRIVLVTLDTLRASATSPYGAVDRATPQLGKFAEQSVQFDRAYVSMPTTGPSHISMLTGLYPRQHGSLQNGVPARSGLASLPQLLLDEGWRTAAFVSVPFLGRAAVGLEGFEVWDTPDAIRDGAETVDRAIDWIRSHAPEPLFVWVHLFDPHSPYETHPNPSPGLSAALDPLAGVPTREDYSFLRAPMTPAEVRKLELLYASEVYYLDQQVGRLLEALAQTGIDGEAMTVIAADHGEILGEVLATRGYGFDHGEFLLPGEIQAALWIRMPGLAGGTKVDTVVETRALFGSMLWAAGLQPAFPTTRLPHFGEGIDGSGDVAFVTRRSFAGQRVPPFLQSERYAVVTAETLAVCADPPEAVVELFDIAGDPLGLLDVAASRPADRERLAGIARTWWNRHAANEQPNPQEIDEELREQLRSLGYVH
jgi:arylsulfatase A-like enzyme